VIARDAGDGSPPPAMTSVRITVSDVNDNRPDIKLEPSLDEKDGFVRVKEHSNINTFILLVSVSDRDTGDGGKVLCFLQLPNGASKLHCYTHYRPISVVELRGYLFRGTGV